MRRLLLGLSLLWIGMTALALNVKEMGAMGDGKHIDSPAINAALARVAGSGGGVVVLPEGVYLCYSIRLQSNVTLRLEKGAVLKAAPVCDTEGYDEAEPNDSRYQDFGHSHWHNSLLWGENLHDVTLEGEGLVDGTGVLQRGTPRQGYVGKPQANKALALRECRNVTIRGLNFLACGHFALLLTGVDDLLIENVTADTNRDGFDIDCCERVTVHGCRVNTPNDDAIVLKCSYALGRPKPTTDVVIEDCSVSGYDTGSVIRGTCTTQTMRAPDGDGPTGRIKLGTESNGGFRHIVIRRCTFVHSRGLALETVDGAAMQNIDVSDLTMTDICNSPIYIRLGRRMRAPEGFHHSSTRNIRIRNVRVTDADSRYACIIAGVEGNPVRDVSIEGVSILYRGDLTMDDVKQQRGSNPFFFKRPRTSGQTMAVTPASDHHADASYPEPSAHGIQPAWGWSVFHAENIRFRNLRLETLHHDERPWLYLDKSRRVRFSKLTILNGD
jgi:polygalacturonase